MINVLPTFTAIDFETANRYRNSACAVGLVRVQAGRVTRRDEFVIRPPFRLFEFTDIHGLTWESVQRSPTFAQLWPRIAPYFRGVDFVAAHNASFDQGVLEACCRWYGIAAPEVPFRCSLRLARATWGLPRNTLQHVADFLDIELDHHRAGSDAGACAQIVLTAMAA